MVNFVNNVLEFRGQCHIQTTLSLEQLADKISRVLCGGLPFIYGKHSIWEEIPSMYIDHSILGMLVIVGGYGGDDGFEVAIWPYGNYSRCIYENKLTDTSVIVRMDLRLYHLLMQGFGEDSQVQIIKPLKF